MTPPPPDRSRTPEPKPSDEALPLSALDFHVLLVLAPRHLYGYAIKKGVEEQSGGVVSPEIGSLYRVIARLMDRGWVADAEDAPPDSGPHRGKPRKYYRITEAGLEVARAEMTRIRGVLETAKGVIPEWAR